MTFPTCVPIAGALDALQTDWWMAGPIILLIFSVYIVVAAVDRL